LLPLRLPRQYTIKPSFRGLSNYPLQTVCNVFGFPLGSHCCGFVWKYRSQSLLQQRAHRIRCCSVDDEHQKAHPGRHHSGLLVSSLCILRSNPNFFAFSSIVGSICIQQLTCTFPPKLYLGYCMKVGVELPGEGFNLTIGKVVRRDRGLKQWVCGFFKNRVLLNIWVLS